jgi:Holliday junction DNA helicase RuvB
VIEEYLYPAMEDYRIEIRLSEGARAQTVTMKIEPFTLVGATTRFGLLTAPMRARFGVVERLNYYPPEELQQIVERSAGIFGVSIDRDGASEIARRSRGTPRIANRLLRRVRDYAQVKSDGRIDGDTSRGALEMLNVDEYGLDEMDARILRAIIENFGGGPVGLGSLAVAVGEDANTLEEVYEPYLIQNGYMHRTTRGRVATPRAFQRFGYALPKDGESAQAGLFGDDG